jgi:pyridinium-3,5-biscarboxylic acid mononucleotide sulfurtransferase
MTDLTPIQQDRLHQLQALLRTFPTVVVAFSGGVDSSLLLKVAAEALGRRCTAVLAVSPSLPTSEREAAVQLAEDLGVSLTCLTTRETEDPAYQANAPNRCFHCKDHVYSALIDHAVQVHPDAVLLDGMNVEDTLDIRPGRAAAMKHGVRSPLHECGFSKEDVRRVARHLGLRVWDKPAAACLASRVAYGTQVTNELLHRIEKAEGFLQSLGFSELRARHHGDIVRLEIPAAEMALAMEHAAALVSGLKALGWLYVTLDLEGLRHGSMNAPLQKA